MLKNTETMIEEVEQNESAGKRKGRLIPDGELKCVWMTAGVVSFKLCNHGYDCDICPFDLAMRKQHEFQAEELAASDESAYLTLSTETSSQTDRAGEKTVSGCEDLFRRFDPIRIRKSFLYHRGHTWVDPADPNLVTVGIDDFAGACLSEIKTIILPALRNRINQGQVCCWIVTEDGTVPILAPLTGTLAATNSSLSQQRDLLNRSPYEQGWLMQVEPDNLARETRHLFGEDKASARCARDAGKLKRALNSLLNKSKKEVGPTLCDGGKTLNHVRDIIGPGRYFELINGFFAGK